MKKIEFINAEVENLSREETIDLCYELVKSNKLTKKEISELFLKILDINKEEQNALTRMEEILNKFESSAKK